ncbi:GNAT family N-acetyltransferase [Phenylobacterium terrae]|uniref:GNAT family N-acetyltransferase n=1 Tax=Phenylobacterium terrae TaxID=2665495 RepID=A0ABW4N294_9CAUL
MRRLQLRRASFSDIEALSELQRNSLMGIAAAHYTPQEMAAFLTHPSVGMDQLLRTAHVWVLGRGRRIDACAGWRRSEAGAVMLRSVYVRTECAGRGLASRLLDHVEAEATRRNPGAIRLVSTLGAQGFYERRGYRAIGATFLHLGEVPLRGVDMVKTLPQAEPRRTAA